MKQDYILLIETSTEACSVALSKGSDLVTEKYTEVPKSHASVIGTFIQDIFNETGMTAADLSAVAVSKGPGSYTGLRVGVSCAKGLCYGAQIPLIGVNTLEVIARCAIDNNLAADASYIVPMIDARRMEVYTAVFSPDLRKLTPTEPMVVDAGSFADRLSEGPVLFIGDAAGKCSGVIGSGNAHFVHTCPRASSMLGPAERELAARNFRDTAYFEPFYLKQFIATVSRKKII